MVESPSYSSCFSRLPDRHPTRSHLEAISPVVREIGDVQLVDALLAPGIANLIGRPSEKILEEVHDRNLTTPWSPGVQNGGVYVYREYQLEGGVHVASMCDAAIWRLTVETPKSKAKIALRDREYDATAHATPPGYAALTQSTPSPQSLSRGAVDWNYSGQDDLVPPGRRSVEISVGAEDKMSSLRNDPRYAVISGFVENPFAALDYMVPEAWWNVWSSIVGKGLEGEAIPYPGQTSVRSVPGYFSRALNHSQELLVGAGYTHISAVPTWQHVLQKFAQRGFAIDCPSVQARYEQFADVISVAPLPVRDTHKTLSDSVGNQSSPAVASWASMAPYALMQWGPNVGGKARDTVRALDVALQNGESESGYHHFPLLPGHNLWMSKELV